MTLQTNLELCCKNIRKITPAATTIRRTNTSAAVASKLRETYLTEIPLSYLMLFLCNCILIPRFIILLELQRLKLLRTLLSLLTTTASYAKMLLHQRLEISITCDVLKTHHRRRSFDPGSSS